MLWPKNSFGDVTLPCALAVAATNTIGSSATLAVCQKRSFRVDIQTSEQGGKSERRRRQTWVEAAARNGKNGIDARIA